MSHPPLCPPKNNIFFAYGKYEKSLLVLVERSYFDTMYINVYYLMFRKKVILAKLGHPPLCPPSNVLIFLLALCDSLWSRSHILTQVILLSFD